MKWLVQSNIPNRSFEGMLSYLDNSGRDVTTVTYTKADSWGKNMKNINDAIFYKNPLPDDSSIGLFGSVRLIKDFNSTYSNYLCPTIITMHDQFKTMLRFFGEEYLNINASYGLTPDLPALLDRHRKIFIKPINDKTFSGVVFDIDKMSDSDLELYEELKTHSYDMIWSTEISLIKREYRFWVIDREIVTQSQYMLDGLVDPNSNVPEEVIQYANKVKGLCPILAYTLDIAEIETQQGNYFKVVEINCVNSSGLYDADDASIIEAIEKINIKDRIHISGNNNGIIDFDVNEYSRNHSSTTMERIDWNNKSPFSDDFLNWFRDLDYEPVVQLYQEGLGFFRIPLFSVTNQIFGECEEEHDAILIRDENIKILYKLAW